MLEVMRRNMKSELNTNPKKIKHLVKRSLYLGQSIIICSVMGTRFLKKKFISPLFC